jgi:hypothetical protein
LRERERERENNNFHENGEFFTEVTTKNDFQELFASMKGLTKESFVELITSIVEKHIVGVPWVRAQSSQEFFS